MRFFYDNKFNFLGFSYNMSVFGALAGVVAFIGMLLIMTVFMPLYPLWYYLAMKNWDKLVVTDPRDRFFHFSGVKPRVFDMTRFEWKMLLVTWIFAVIATIIIIVKGRETEKRQKELSKIEELRRDRKIREDSIRYLKWQRDNSNYNPANISKRSVAPSRELDYFERHRDDYLDDPEDILIYPDEIFDFYAD